MVPNKIDKQLHILVEKKGSDLHLQADCPPVFRVHGELCFSDTEPISQKDIQDYLLNVLTESQKKKFEQAQHIDFSYTIAGLARFRVNVFEQRGGFGAAIRLIPPKIPTIDELGLPAILKELALKPHGLVIVTGPTGSGKSTTLAALIDYINANRKGHIITIEDPLEFIHENKSCVINQREVGRHTESFATALKGTLREDPDVILVGEMRELDTISNAITAAETGHLVFSTLHTGDVVQAIDRMIDVFPPSQQNQVRSQLASILQAVVSQVLLRRKDGAGRVAAFEVMVANSAIRNLIKENKTHLIYNVIQTSRGEGMLLLKDSLISLFQKKLITADEALSKVSDTKILEKELIRSQYVSFQLSTGKLEKP